MTGQRDVLQIHLFGGFSLSYDGEPLAPLASRHARLLFAWLVLQGGRPQARTLLCHRFWPDVPEARARRRLSHALWQVQDCFSERSPNQPYLLTPGDTVAFDASVPHWLDVEEFEQRLDEVDRAGSVDGVGLRHLRRCIELYQGDLLAGSYESWVVSEQDRLRQRHVTALGRLVDACKQRSNFDEALAVARRLTHHAPLREDAHREVMRLCVLLDQPGNALEQFERCRSVLAEELGTPPSATTQELYEKIARSRSTGTQRRSPIEELEPRRLIGRDGERVRLVDQLERTLGGSAGTVYVEGEPGVGKTQLLTQTTEDAHWRGFTVLWGSCAGADVPYAAIRHAVLPELHPVRVAQLRAMVAPVWLQEASRLLPPLTTDQPPGGGLSGADGAERMRQALGEVITGLAAIDPVVIVLEDLHRADQETLALLGTLAQHPDPGRLLVLLSYRDVEARQDEAVWSALRALDREARPLRIELEPLSAFETAALLQEVLGTPHVPAAFAGAVHRECGGNPLYVLELLRALRDAGTLVSGVHERLDTVAIPVTAGLRTLIGDRLELLGEDAAAVAELGAVLGVDFDLTTLEAGSNLAPRQLSAALGELVRRNLFRLEADRCQFSHAATRRVVLDRVGEERMQALHRTAAAALEATRPDAVEALASHLLGADEPARALPYLRRAAARAVELHAYATAANHLDAAIVLSDQVPTTVADRTTLLLQAETVLDVLGRREQQAATLRRLVGLVGGDAELGVEVSLRRATHLGHVDLFEEAVTVARDAVARVPAGRTVLRGRALTSLGQVLGWRGDNESAVTVLREATDLLDREPLAKARARHALGTALRFLQRFEEADAELTAALTTAEAAGDEVAGVRALGALADLRTETGRTDEAIDLYDRAVATARRIGFRHREGVGLVNLGTARLIRAEPGRGLAAYDKALRIFKALGNHRGISMVQLNRAWLRHRWLGQDTEAEADASSARDHFAQVGAHGQVAVCLETLAGVARHRGELDVAERHVRAGLIAARQGHDQRAEVQLLRSHVEVALAQGDPVTAIAVATAAVDRARQLGLHEFVADLASLAALAAIDLDEPTVATDHLRTASSHLATSGEPHRIHHRLALVAAATGHGSAAAHHHVTAHRLLEAALADLDERTRATAVTEVPEHRAVVEAGTAHSPRTVNLRMARAEAPRGRALQPGELVAITLQLGPPATSPAQRRRQLLDVLTQVDDQGAAATVEDLSTILDVSTSTVRRDLQALRATGAEATTRGTGMG